MSSVLHPVGSQPPRVYWVRRAIFLSLLVVAVAFGALAFRLVSSGGTSAASPSHTPSPSTSAAGTPQACPTTALTVGLAAGGASFPAGANPTFTLTVSNTGAAACTVDAGEAARELLVVSGSDRIWSSKDCAQPADASKLLLLTPGQQYAAKVPWPRVRSTRSGRSSGTWVPPARSPRSPPPGCVAVAERASRPARSGAPHRR